MHLKYKNIWLTVKFLVQVLLALLFCINASLSLSKCLGMQSTSYRCTISTTYMTSKECVQKIFGCSPNLGEFE